MTKETLSEEIKYILHTNHPEIGVSIAREYNDLTSVNAVYAAVVLGGYDARICLQVTSVVEYQLSSTYFRK